MRTIDADALEDKAKRYSLGYYEEDQWAVPLEAIDEAPTIDAVEVVHGEWIDRSGGIEGAWNYCSVCGEQAIDLYDYCPNCGAHMREREGE